MTTESQADFARRCGKSRKTVSAWKKAGRLVLKGDQVEVEATLELMERHRKGGAPIVTPSVTLAVTQATEGNSQGNNAARDKPEKSAVDVSIDDIEMLPGETTEEAADRLVGEVDMNMSFDEARRIKEVYLALLNRLEFEQKSGALVDLVLAESILFEGARAARDAWLNWPAKYAPLIAAEIGAAPDKVMDVLTAHVHKQIAQLGEPEANFSER